MPSNHIILCRPLLLPPSICNTSIDLKWVGALRYFCHCHKEVYISSHCAFSMNPRKDPWSSPEHSLKLLIHESKGTTQSHKQGNKSFGVSLRFWGHYISSWKRLTDRPCKGNHIRRMERTRGAITSASVQESQNRSQAYSTWSQVWRGHVNLRTAHKLQQDFLNSVLNDPN